MEILDIGENANEAILKELRRKRRERKGMDTARRRQHGVFAQPEARLFYAMSLSAEFS